MFFSVFDAPAASYVCLRMRCAHPSFDFDCLLHTITASKLGQVAYIETI